MDFPDPKYRRLCNQATLHVKDGFFPELLAKITEDVGQNWIDTSFSVNSLDKDKVRVCCTDKRVWNIIYDVLKNIEKHFRKKSSKGALEARLLGEKAMKEGSFQKAVMLFSQSAIKAPKIPEDFSTDEGLSLFNALRSRAQAFFSLNRFQDCLSDLNLCIEEGCPEPWRYQIYRIMGDAYKNLNEEKRAKISWQISLKLLDEQIGVVDSTEVKGSRKTKNKDVKLKQVLEKEREELKKLLTGSPNKGLVFAEVSHPQTYELLPEITGEVHEKFNNASSMVSIRRTMEEGRFAVAGSNIPTGTTLVVEEPHASVLIVDKFGSHCHHCYARLHAAVPCGKCAGVAYCSLKCRTSAITYHQFECEFLGLFQGAGLSALSYLALRMVTQQGFSFFKTLQGKIESLKKGDNEQLSDREAKYVHVYNLTSHSGLRPNEDFFHRTVMSMFLVQCLRGTNFFPSASSGAQGTFSEDEILTASVILHHLQILQFNAHELYETRTTAKGHTKSAKSVYIAVGIYPTVALFNHECAPAVTRYFHGKNIIIRTVRPLKKGDVISENYGPIYTKRNKMERIRDLTSRYWFTCICEPCREEWPTLDELDDEHLRLRCSTPDCRMIFPAPASESTNETNPRCSSCFNRINLKEILKHVTHYQALYDRGIQYLQDNRSENAEPLLTVFLDKVFDISPPPSREIALAQEALRTCYAQTGNIWIMEN